MAGTAFVFLNGYYHRGDRLLVNRQLRRRRPRPLIIAVDGGLSFVQRCGLPPDFWLTDLDSAPTIRKGFLSQAQLLLHPSIKDKTDGELALEFCSRNNLTDITIFGWYDSNGETDHLLGNLLLYENHLKGKRPLRVRYLDSRQEIYPVSNEKQRLVGYRGRRLSVVPISRRIVLTLRGTAFPARELVVNRGQSIALRNRITARQASVTVRGAALILVGE